MRTFNVDEIDGSPFKMTPQVQAAALPTVVTPVGTNLIVSGWGTTSESNSIYILIKHFCILHLQDRIKVIVGHRHFYLCII